MPTMYRIGCLRDGNSFFVFWKPKLKIFLFIDVIFFIYLYQRYIYPVDKSRTNEFGTSGEDHAEQQEQNQQAIDNTQSEQTESSSSDHLKSE